MRYYRILAEECEPIGSVINPNIAFTACSCATQSARARKDSAWKTCCSSHIPAGYYYFYGEHEPGKSQLWETYKNTPGAGVGVGGTIGMILGTPQDAREALRVWRNAGIDQVILLTQCGKMPQEATFARSSCWAAR